MTATLDGWDRMNHLAEASDMRPSSGRSRMYGGVVICFITLIWFIPQILSQNDFRTDDFYLFTVLGEHGLVWPWESGQYLNFMGFRPVSMVLFLGQLHLFGTYPLGYYLVGLLLHIVSLLLFYAVVLTTMGNFVDRMYVHIAVLTTLVVSVHADLFYNVLWISNQTETLALLLSMLYVVVMLRYLTTGKWMYGAFGMLILLIGFFVKFSIVILPFLFAVVAWVYFRAGKSPVTWSRLLIMATLGMLLAFGLVAYWLALDRYDEVLSVAILPTKLYSVIAIIMIAVHPWVAESLYPFMYEQRFIALLLGVFALAVLSIFLRSMNREHRYFVLISAVLLLVAVLPRAVHQIAPRINTLQITVLMLLLGLGLAMFRPRWASWLMGLVLVSHIVASLVIIPGWRAETANTKYVQLLREEVHTASTGSILLVHQTIFDQYALHFYRTGRFGKDTVLAVSPVRLLRKYGVRAEKEYDIRRNQGIVELVANDIRTGFMADTTVPTPAWLEMIFHEPLRDYGYRRACIDVSAAPEGLRLLVERAFAYEEIRR